MNLQEFNLPYAFVSSFPRAVPHLPISFQPRRGGGARGRGVRCGVGVSVCVSCGYTSRRPSVTVCIIINNEGALKKDFLPISLPPQPTVDVAPVRQAQASPNLRFQKVDLLHRWACCKEKASFRLHTIHHARAYSQSSFEVAKAA